MFPFLSGVRLDMEMSGFLVAVLWITRCANFEKMLVLLALRLRGHYVKSSRSGWLMLLSPILFYDWTSSYIPGSSDTKYFCIVNISKRSIGRFNQCVWYSIEPLYFLFFSVLLTMTRIGRASTKYISGFNLLASSIFRRRCGCSNSVIKLATQISLSLR